MTITITATKGTLVRFWRAANVATFEYLRRRKERRRDALRGVLPIDLQRTKLFSGSLSPAGINSEHAADQVPLELEPPRDSVSMAAGERCNVIQSPDQQRLHFFDHKQIGFHVGQNRSRSFSRSSRNFRSSCDAASASRACSLSRAGPRSMSTAQLRRCSIKCDSSDSSSAVRLRECSADATSAGSRVDPSAMANASASNCDCSLSAISRDACAIWSKCCCQPSFVSCRKC